MITIDKKQAADPKDCMRLPKRLPLTSLDILESFVE
jgi:hypothetical protein